MIIKKISDNYQSSRWVMVYRRYKCQNTPYRNKAIEKKYQIKEEKNQGKLWKSNYHWNYWKFQLHWNKIE